MFVLALAPVCVSAEEGEIDFSRDIRPILSDTCLKCHGPDAGARKGRLHLGDRTAALKSEVLTDGEMRKRLLSADPEERMPPPEAVRKLKGKDREVLVKWLKAGGDWPEDDRHWAFVPPKKPELPEVKDPAWVRNGVDRFVLSKLEDEGLRPLPEAEKAYVAGLKGVKKPSVRQSLLYQLGWVQYRQERYPEAVAQLSLLLKEFPEGNQRAEALLLAGECQYLAKNWKEAVVHFEMVVADKNATERSRALYRSGTCHLNLKQWSQAQQRFEALLKEFPKYPQLSAARYGLGLALQKQNQLARALVVFEQVTKETNTEAAAKARFMIGEIAFSKKQYKVAYSSFLVAAFKYPYEEWQAKGYLEAGRCFKELKDNAKARELLETVIKKFPKRPEAKSAAQVLTTLPKPKTQ